MRATLLTTFVSIGIALSGCQGAPTGAADSHESDPDETASAASEHTIRIGVTPHCISAPLFAARSTGAFTREGVSVKFVKFEDGKHALHAMLRGDLDYAIAGDVPIAAAALDRKDVAVLTTIATSSYENWIVARSGINTIEDLVGKRVGVLRRSGKLYVLETLLRHHGLSHKQLTIVNMHVEKAREALEAGTIDAFVLDRAPRQPLSEQFGKDAAAVKDPTGYRPTLNLVTSHEVLKREGDQVHHLLSAILEGTASVAKDPTTFATEVETALGHGGEDAESIEEGCSRLTFQPTMGKTLAHMLHKETSWFTAMARQPHEPIDFTRLLHAGPLRQIRPEAVMFGD